jgi:hypothetical protein
VLPKFSRKTKYASEGVDKVAREWWSCGRRPEELFTLVQEDKQSEACLPGGGVLLFTTRMLASEYAKVTQLDARANAITAADFPSLAGFWMRRGRDSFALDCCARCSAANLVSLETLRYPEGLGYLWAVTLILRAARMRQFAGCAFQSLLRKRIDEIVPKLKELRDHVDPGCAALHYALALLSTTEVPEKRRQLLAVSRERLMELGREDLADDVPAGVEGLLLGFSLLRQMAEGNFDAAPPTWEKTAAAASVM